MAKEGEGKRAAGGEETDEFTDVGVGNSSGNSGDKLAKKLKLMTSRKRESGKARELQIIIKRTDSKGTPDPAAVGINASTESDGNVIISEWKATKRQTGGGRELLVGPDVIEETTHLVEKMLSQAREAEKESADIEYDSDAEMDLVIDEAADKLFPDAKNISANNVALLSNPKEPSAVPQDTGSSPRPCTSDRQTRDKIDVGAGEPDNVLAEPNIFQVHFPSSPENVPGSASRTKKNVNKRGRGRPRKVALAEPLPKKEEIISRCSAAGRKIVGAKKKKRKDQTSDCPALRLTTPKIFKAKKSPLGSVRELKVPILCLTRLEDEKPGASVIVGSADAPRQEVDKAVVSFSSTAQRHHCYLCELPRMEWAIVFRYSEPVCRGCLNFEGSDQIEAVLVKARNMKKASGRV